jgi:hypothetical protein
MTKRWIKWPQPGQIRGEGKWEESTPITSDYFEHCKRTGWLPTAEQDEKPDDDGHQSRLSKEETE